MSVDTEIRDLLRRINECENRIDGYRNQKSEIDRKIRNFEDRRRDVQSVKNTLSNSFDWTVGAIQRKQRNTRGGIEAGTTGMLGSEATLLSSLDADMEKATESDGYGSQMHGALQSEIGRCDREISALEGRKRSLDGSIQSERTTRARLVRQARELAKDPEATEHVWEREWY